MKSHKSCCNKNETSNQSKNKQKCDDRCVPMPDYCAVLDQAPKLGYPCGDQNPTYLEGPAQANGSQSWNKNFDASGREVVLYRFHEYVKNYENEWCPFDTSKCPPVRSQDKSLPRAYVAINSVKLRVPQGLDKKAFFQMMRMISSHMCMATAGQPGFLGYDIIVQTGSCPAMLRWAVDADNLPEDADFWMDQYTVWRSYEDHENFHELFEDVVMEACMHCGMVMTEGPYEPVYAVLDRHLPRVTTQSTYMKYLTSPERYSDDPVIKNKAEKNVKGYAVDTGKINNVQMFYDVIPGHEEIFEKYINQVFTNLMNTGHCLGYMVLRKIGLNTSGTGNYNIKSMYWEFMDKSGIRQLEATASLPETFPSQSKYLIRSDWSSVEAIKMYLSQVHTDRRNLFPFSLGVLDRAETRPEVRVSYPHKSDYRWLEYLNDTMNPPYNPYEDNQGPDGHTLDNIANLPFTPDLCRDKWYGFFGYEKNKCNEHRVESDSACGRLKPVDANFESMLPAIPGQGPNPCRNPCDKK